MPKFPSGTPLTRERITQAALAATRCNGQPPSMRRLAADLAVTPGALYRHVTGQDELVALMVDALMSRVEMLEEADEPDPWVRISAYVRSLISTLEPYPGMGRLIAGAAYASNAARTRQRWLLQQLKSTGLTRADSERAYAVLETYWLGSVQHQSLSPKTFIFGLDRIVDGLRNFTRSADSHRA